MRWNYRAALIILYFFRGDGDFRVLVESLQRKGRKVSVFSTIRCQPPMIADDLRRQADYFVDIADLQTELGRTGGDSFDD